MACRSAMSPMAGSSATDGACASRPIARSRSMTAGCVEPVSATANSPSRSGDARYSSTLAANSIQGRLAAGEGDRPRVGREVGPHWRQRAGHGEDDERTADRHRAERVGGPAIGLQLVRPPRRGRRTTQRGHEVPQPDRRRPGAEAVQRVVGHVGVEVHLRRRQPFVPAGEPGRQVEVSRVQVAHLVSDHGFGLFAGQQPEQRPGQVETGTGQWLVVGDDRRPRHEEGELGTDKDVVRVRDVQPGSEIVDHAGEPRLLPSRDLDRGDLDSSRRVPGGDPCEDEDSREPADQGDRHRAGIGMPEHEALDDEDDAGREHRLPGHQDGQPDERGSDAALEEPHEDPRVTAAEGDDERWCREHDQGDGERQDGDVDPQRGDRGAPAEREIGEDRLERRRDHDGEDGEDQGRDPSERRRPGRCAAARAAHNGHAGTVADGSSGFVAQWQRFQCISRVE